MLVARRFLISGRVQGVGFRFFVEAPRGGRGRARLGAQPAGRPRRSAPRRRRGVGRPRRSRALARTVRRRASTTSTSKRRRRPGARPDSRFGSCQPLRSGEIDLDALKAKIRHVPDFPKAGILFYDVTTLLRDPDGFRLAIDSLADPYKDRGIEPRRRHREPRLHPRRGGRRSHRRRLRAGAQGRQAAVEDRARSATISSTAATASRCTATRSSRGSAC